ncbi:hypothetical protein J6590_043773 [Homalodisca vitripennis]|nr:hypothetical protein J6590_043773 [Homalodisca vitripennis]
MGTDNTLLIGLEKFWMLLSGKCFHICLTVRILHPATTTSFHQPRNPMNHRPMQMLHSEEVPQFVQVEVGDVEHQQFIVYAD